MLTLSSSSCQLDCIVGTMNKRLLPSYLVNLISQSAVTLLGFHNWTRQIFLDSWLRDSLASTHTDLIYFARQEEPSYFCFSPFQYRPLGKDLPNLLSTCKCLAGGYPGGKKQKIWKVTHDGRDLSQLKDVTIQISCSFCRKRWSLREPGLPGVLHKCGGLYGAEIPYFLD